MDETSNTMQVYSGKRKPLTGYIMVLKTTGRKTGRQRFTPVNYAILDGKVFCLAGFGKLAHWYRNLPAQRSRRGAV